MPRIYDLPGGGSTTRASLGARKSVPKRKARPVTVRKKPSPVTYVPGLGAVTRPTPRMKHAARAKRSPVSAVPGLGAVTRPKAKPRPASKPAPRRNPVSAVPGLGAATRPKPKQSAAERERGPFTKHPVKGMLDAEHRAIEALGALHASDPKKYETALAKAGLRERATAGPRGQTIEHYKGKNTREALESIRRPAPTKKRDIILAPRGIVTHQSGVTGGQIAETALRNAPSDATELLMTMPTSIARQAKTLATDPKQFVKDQAAPYIAIAKHPEKEFAERPVSTTLALMPFGRGIPRGVGAVARKTGKQTLARAEATLPGTALTEINTGSRDALIRHGQSKKDKETPAPKVTRRAVQRRVDEHHDFAQQKIQEAGDRAAKEAKALGHDKETGQAHIEAAREHARREMDRVFVREFGAHQRPAVGGAEKKATKAERAQAKAREERAKRTVEARTVDVKTALEAAKAARGGGSEHLPHLEAQRTVAQRALAAEQGKHTKARIEHAEAHGSARVSAAKPKTTDKARELRRKRRNAEKGTVTREEYIANRPRPARDSPVHSVEELTANVKAGEPGFSIESEFVKRIERGTKKVIGHGAEMPGSKVVVFRDEAGKPVGALSMALDEHGKPDIVEVAVDPKARGRGIGTALYAYAQKHGYDVEAASGKGGLTEAGAALAHKRLSERKVTPELRAAKAARAAVSEADRHLTAVSRKGVAAVRNSPEVIAARAAVQVTERTVTALERQLAREQERASRLEGITEGRHAAGRMTTAAGRAAADQAEKIGHLNEALHEARKRASAANGHLKAIEGEVIHGARQASKAAREHLKAAERDARTTTRTKVADIDRALGDEQRRVAGVAPKQADRLHGAIAGLDSAAAGVRGTRAQIRDLDQRISAERARTSGVPHAQMNKLVNAIAARDEARARLGEHQAEHVSARARDISVKVAAANAALIGGGKQGRVFAHKTDANKVAQRLNDAAHEVADGRVRKKASDTVPLEFEVRKLGEDGFAVVPKIAAERRYKSTREKAPMSHASVGTSPNTYAKLFRVSRRLFTQATLPLSPKWLFGQGAEAGVRSAIAGAGPLDLMRFNKVVKDMNAKKAGSGDDLKLRVMGGQFGLTGPAREFAQGTKTLAEEFAGTGLERPAQALTRAGATLPARAVRAGWRRYTSTVLGSVNGFFETNARKAMAGQAIKQGVFNERRFNAISDKAIKNAAKGLKGTEAQVALARQVDRMYGQYQKFSPEMRSSLLHTTPFLPWYLNSINFLLHVLPRDHPYVTSMMVAASTTTEDWRKEHGLSTKGETHRPDFLMGGYPFGADEKISRLSQFVPWGVASDPASSAGSIFLPQFLGPLANEAFGVDWTGKPLRDQDYQKFSGKAKTARAITSALEAQVPGVAQAGRLSGLTKKYVDKKAPEEIEPFKTRLKRELPLVPVGEANGGDSGGGVQGIKVKPIKIKAVKVKPIKIKPVKVGG